MYVRVQSRTRSAVVALLETFQTLLDFVDSTEDGGGCFPQLMACEGQGAFYTVSDAVALATELVVVGRELEARSKRRSEDLQPIVSRMLQCVMASVRRRESLCVEVVRRPAEARAV